MTTHEYAYVPFGTPQHPEGIALCATCEGRGVTGEQYEMPTDGPTLLVDVFCPACHGCGNGDPEHVQCPPGVHAVMELEEENDDEDQDTDEDMDGPKCPSCHGRQWNAVQAFPSDEGDDEDDVAMVYLRVPCGCTADRAMEVTEQG